MTKKSDFAVTYCCFLHCKLPQFVGSCFSFSWVNANIDSWKATLCVYVYHLDDWKDFNNPLWIFIMFLLISYNNIIFVFYLTPLSKRINTTDYQHMSCLLRKFIQFNIIRLTGSYVINVDLEFRQSLSDSEMIRYIK